MSNDPSPSDYLGNITFTVLDVETTGLSADSGHRICEIALLRFRGGKVLDSFESLIDPQRSISPGASAVNGLTDFQVNGQPILKNSANRYLPGTYTSTQAGSNGVRKEVLAAMAIIMAKVRGFRPDCRAVAMATGNTTTAAA